MNKSHLLEYWNQYYTSTLKFIGHDPWHFLYSAYPHSLHSQFYPASPPSKFKLDLLFPKSIGVLLRWQATHVKRKSSYRAKNVKSLKYKLDLDLWTPKSIEVLLGSWSTHVWSIINVCHKEIELTCRNYKKFEVQIWPWPLNPKINRGPPRVMVNTCEVSSLHAKRKLSYVLETGKSLKSKFDFDLLIPKSIEVLLRSWSTHVWSIIIVCQKEKEISPLPKKKTFVGRGGGL